MTAYRRARAVLLALTLLAPMAHAAGDVAAVIPVRHRFARDVAESARTVLSPTGSLAVNEASNALVVRDTPAGVAAVRSVLEALDQAPRTVVLSVTTTTRAELESAAAGVDVLVSPHRLAFGVVLDAGRLQSSEEVRQTIRVESGGEAQLFAGASRPATVRTGRRTREVVITQAGDGLYARPTVLPDGRIRVELAPQSTRFAAGPPGATAGSSAATTVVVDEGDAVVVGGVDQAGERDTRSLTGGSEAREQRSLVYLLRVTTEGGSPPR